MAAKRSSTALKLIAAFKFVKAAALIVVGVGTLGLLSPERNLKAQDWLKDLFLNSGSDLASSAAGRLLHVLHLSGSTRLWEIALGAFLFAAVFVVEGVGLAMARGWAEYLTVAVTISFRPFEVIALAKEWTWLRAGILLLNLMVVGYLSVRLRQARKK
ncbi:MAG TPA: DUF2127 domain-containing protein [Gemmatimonadales bacterium]|nr:DUF2127 domain-containing protein [Gemmatimonadales bacterium]